MKITKTGLISIASACLLTPVIAQAGNFETAVKEAKIEIDKAKAANYEWRDSRKMLETAEKLNKEGQTDKAMKLVEQAKMQGQVAVSQAELQSSVNGPR